MAQFGYGPKKGFKAGKRDLRGVDPNAKIGGGDGRAYPGGSPNFDESTGKYRDPSLVVIKPIPVPKPIEGEKPIVPKPMPNPDKPGLKPITPMPGKPSPMPGKPKPPITGKPLEPMPGKPIIMPIRPKPNPIDIIKKRFNDPNGFYNNPRY